MKKYIFFIFLIGLFQTGLHAIHAANLMTVRVPVTNVRKEPVEHNGKYENDPLQETQLEMGDTVLVSEIKNGWAHVECPDQIEFTHNNRWQGYPGWVKAIDLSTDVASSKVLTQPSNGDKIAREQIIHKAYQHIGSSYLWGGRSLHDKKNTSVATGVDCSGLINWSFREVGLSIPRDAHEQFLKSRRINPLIIKPADLIFIAKASNPEKISHVMFYIGEGYILEAPQSGEVVRRMSFHDRFGKNISQLKNGEKVGDNILYFGTFFGIVE